MRKRIVSTEQPYYGQPHFIPSNLKTSHADFALSNEAVKSERLHPRQHRKPDATSLFLLRSPCLDSAN
jgi:hypothetical protein